MGMLSGRNCLFKKKTGYIKTRMENQLTALTLTLLATG
jgi:hypothetical protein